MHHVCHECRKKLLQSFHQQCSHIHGAPSLRYVSDSAADLEEATTLRLLRICMAASQRVCETIRDDALNAGDDITRKRQRTQ